MRNSQELVPSETGTVERKKTRVNAMKIEKIDKFNSGMKGKLLEAQKEEEDRWKRDLDDTRQRELQEFKQSGGNTTKNVLMPEYKLDERLNVQREVNAPPASMYIGLGWDPTPESKKRHYRRYYAQELETVKEVMPVASPFASF